MMARGSLAGWSARAAEEPDSNVIDVSDVRKASIVAVKLLIAAHSWLFERPLNITCAQAFLRTLQIQVTS